MIKYLKTQNEKDIDNFQNILETHIPINNIDKGYIEQNTNNIKNIDIYNDTESITSNINKKLNNMKITQTTNKNIIKKRTYNEMLLESNDNINNLNQSNNIDNNDININTELESDSEDNKPFKKKIIYSKLL